MGAGIFLISGSAVEALVTGARQINPSAGRCMTCSQVASSAGRGRTMVTHMIRLCCVEIAKHEMNQLYEDTM